MEPTRTERRTRSLQRLAAVGLFCAMSAVTAVAGASPTDQKPGPDGTLPVAVASLISDQTVKHTGPSSVALTSDIANLADLGADNLAASVENPTDRTVSVYKYAGYQGTCVNVAPRSSVALADTPMGTRQVSSVRINGACPEVVRVFGSPGFTGPQAVVSTSTTEISTINPKLQRSAVGVQNNTVRPVAVFTGPDFTGTCYVVPAGGWIEDITVGPQTTKEYWIRSVRLSSFCPAHDLNAMADFNRDGIGDLLAIDASGRKVEARVLTPADTYKKVRARMITPVDAAAMSFATGDVNRDGYSDLVVVRPQLGKRGEVINGWPLIQAISGRDDLREVLFTRRAPFSVGPSWSYEVGDVDRDGWVDLVAFDNTSGEVQIVTASARNQFSTVTGRYNTRLHTDPTFEFALADLRFDGVVDVLAIRQRPGQHAEVNVLRSSDRFVHVRAQITIPIIVPDHTRFEFEAADTNGDRWVDLLAIDHHDPGSQRTAVFTMSSKNDFATVTGADFTALPPTSSAWQFE